MSTAAVEGRDRQEYAHFEGAAKRVCAQSSYLGGEQRRRRCLVRFRGRDLRSVVGALGCNFLVDSRSHGGAV